MELNTRNKFLLFDYLKNRGVSFTEAGKNIGEGWIGVSSCPLCGDQRNHFGVNKETGNFHCWVCGAHGGIKRLITLIDEVPFSEAEEIFSEFSVSESIPTIPQNSSVIVSKPSVELPPHILPLYDAFHRYPYVLNYLTKRGFTLKDIETWNAYFCYSGDFAERIIFPVYVNKTLVTFTGRAVLPTSLRYKTLTKTKSLMSIKDCMFNWEYVEEGDKVVICEGVFDALKVSKLCQDGKAVALFGKQISGSQKLLLMQKKLSQVVILLDRDAWADSLRIQSELTGLIGCPVLARIPQSSDPASAKTLDELSLPFPT